MQVPVSNDIELINIYYHGSRELTKEELLRLQDAFMRGLSQVARKLNSKQGEGQ